MQRKNTDPRHPAGSASAASALQAAPEFAEKPLWDDRDLSRFLKRSRSRIQKDRTEGRGVPFIRIGRLIRYDPAVVRDYVRSGGDIR